MLRESSGGLAVFMRELDAFMRVHGGYQTWSITLVGHSMGAIIVNRMIREHPNLPIDRVVYLAAACSLADYDASITPAPTRPTLRAVFSWETRSLPTSLFENRESRALD